MAVEGVAGILPIQALCWSLAQNEGGSPSGGVCVSSGLVVSQALAWQKTRPS